MKGTDDPLADPLQGADRPVPDGGRSEVYDRDLDVRGILWSAAYLGGGIVVVCVLMWWLFLGLRRLGTRSDPPPPPLAEERAPQPPPPGPRLQASPDRDMIQLRAGEDRTLNQPAWIDRGQGTVRLPIDLAMDVLARRAASGQAAGQATPSPAAPESGTSEGKKP